MTGRRHLRAVHDALGELEAQQAPEDVDEDSAPDQVTLGREVSVREGGDVAAPEALVTGVVVHHPGDLLPVVPPWMRDPQARRAMVRWWARRQGHRVLFHGFRLPVYLFRLVVFAPVGFGRTAWALVAWVLDGRADPMEQDLAVSGKHNAEDFRKLREQRTRRVQARCIVVGGFAVVLAVGAGIAWSWQPRIVPWVLLVAGVLGFARLGAPKGRPLLGQAMAASSTYRVLTDAIVVRALRGAGLAGAAARVDAKTGNEITEDTRATLAAPIARAENGSGYVVTVDLPYGKGIEDAMRASSSIASGLDVDDTQLIVEKVAGSVRRVTMYVADEDPFRLPPRVSPLVRLPQVSVWEPHPLGKEPRGREACLSLIFNSVLIGAIPRSGKTFAARAMVAPAILDPFCDVIVLDFKGGKDWMAAEQVAMAHRVGDDEEDLIYGVTILEQMKKDAQERFKAFRAMSDAENPEGKLTAELAKAGMRPRVIAIDEVQNLLRAGNKDIRSAALDLLIWLAKTAPAAGFILIMATQRPAAEVTPADLRDNTSIRLALRTKTWRGSDAILGDGIAAIGYGSHRFTEDHKGAAILGGVPNGRGGDLSVIRTDLITNDHWSRICQAGRMRREDAGTLTGHAAGVELALAATVTVVEDVIAVWPGETVKVAAAVLVPRLREMFPERYGAWDPEDPAPLTRALKEHGVSVVQVNRQGSNRNGYTLAAIRKAAAKGSEGQEP